MAHLDLGYPRGPIPSSGIRSIRDPFSVSMCLFHPLLPGCSCYSSGHMVVVLLGLQQTRQDRNHFAGFAAAATSSTLVVDYVCPLGGGYCWAAQ
eukprot:scaffold293081_cov33-Tisochrysis_lutea.AAC.2